MKRFLSQTILMMKVNLNHVKRVKRQVQRRKMGDKMREMRTELFSRKEIQQMTYKVVEDWEALLKYMKRRAKGK